MLRVYGNWLTDTPNTFNEERLNLSTAVKTVTFRHPTESIFAKPSLSYSLSLPKKGDGSAHHALAAEGCRLIKIEQTTIAVLVTCISTGENYTLFRKWSTCR